MWEFLQHQLVTNQFFSAGLVVSICGGLIFALKQLPKLFFEKIKSRVIFTATIYQFDPLFDDFEAWFLSKYKDKYRNVEAVSREMSGKGGSTPRYEPGQYISNQRHTLYKQIEGLFFIKYKGRIINISKGRDKLDHTSDIRSLYMNQYHVSCFNGASVIKELLDECIAFNSKKEPDELKIWSHDAYGSWYVSGHITAKNIDSVILPHYLKKRILEDIDQFQQSKEWYNRAGIFYKRGHLYNGFPGNGKTSISLAAASYMGRDVYCLDLNSINENDGLKRLFSSMSSNAFLLIEDIDGFFHLRESVKKDSKISFSTFLNCIDGAFYKEGLFTSITTNKLELVDPALMRSGRMDLVLEIPQPGVNEINQYLSTFFDGDYSVTSYNHNYSMCDIQEICIRNKNNPESALKELNSMLKIA